MLRLTRMIVGDQSLHKQLLLWLVLPQLVLWMAAAFVSEPDRCSLAPAKAAVK